MIVTLAVSVEKNIAQEREKFRPPPAAPSSVDANLSGILIASGENYHIGAGDMIEVKVELAPELSRSFRVTADGTFSMPLLGRLSAEQKTAEDLEKMIADGLRAAGYLTNPNVTVVIKQINSQSFFIQGAVRHPGVYQIEGRPSLLRLITVAGGLADNYSTTAFIIREAKPKDPAPQGANHLTANRTESQRNVPLLPESDTSPQGPECEVIRVNISGLLTGRTDQNIFVEAGDIVNIPPTDVFFVAGEVREPGSFPLKAGTTLRQAIALAQGTTFKAMASRGIIFREDLSSGKREEIKVDIGAVMNGKQEDLIIKANDIIIIPNSQSKSVGSALLSAFGINAMGNLPILLRRY